MPGKRRSRFASTSFSRRMNSSVLSGRAGDRHEAPERGRDLDAGERGALFLLLGELDGERQRQVRDERERVRRVEGQGRQDREHHVLEVGRELLAPLGLDLVPLEDPHARFGQARPEVFGEGPDRERRVPFDDLADHPELLVRGQPVGAAFRDRGLDLLVQPRDPDHEELVEVRVEDREELDPLEQRPARVERFLEHAPVEGQPRDLPVEVERVVVETVVGGARASNELHFAHRRAHLRKGSERYHFPVKAASDTGRETVLSTYRLAFKLLRERGLEARAEGRSRQGFRCPAET